jgi:hypothetical protein
VVLSKVAPEEYAPAFLRLCVVGKQSKTPFALVTEGLELRDEVAHAVFEVLGRHHDVDAAFLIPLNEARLLKIGDQHLTNPSRHSRRVGKGLRRRGALLARPSGERLFQALQMPNAWTTERLKVLLDFEVGGSNRRMQCAGWPSRPARPIS